MRIETVEYKVYQYNELSEEAKEKAKQWYLDGQESYIFTDDCKEDLYNLFGKTNLKVQYSLGYCQGDGFNIYGDIAAENIFNCLEKHNGGVQLEEFENILTEKEKKTILKYKVVLNNKYNSYRCPCCNKVVNASEHYCSQCGQKLDRRNKE